MKRIVSQLLLTFGLLTTFPQLSKALTVDSFNTTTTQQASADVQFGPTNVAPAFSGSTATGAIGGFRKIIAQKTSPGAGDEVRGRVDNSNRFKHSQDVGVTGSTTIILDGTATPTTNYQGLGGVNFAQDLGTGVAGKFIVEVFSFDNAFGSSTCNVAMTAFDASSATGNKFLTLTKTLVTAVNPGIDPVFNLEFPFADFTPNYVGAGFTNIGAIQIQFSCGGDTDLSIRTIRTNGVCDEEGDVPNASGDVIDDCGVCITDNPSLDSKSCKDCLGVPNGTATSGTTCSTGEIGLCDPGKWTVTNATPPITCSCTRDYTPTPESCDGVDNDCDGIVDCDLCKEGYSSCTDCNGVYNGPSRLDRCGVCEGDGKSCLNCTERNIEAELTAMDAQAKKQEKLLRVIYARIDKANGGKNKKLTQTIKKLRAEAHKLQIRNWILSWTIPAVHKACTNTAFCIQTDNTSIIKEYRLHADQLRQMTADAVVLLRKTLKSTSKTLGTSYVVKGDAYYQEALSYADAVPLTQSKCSDPATF